jgi:acyl-[acyl-carrier-protein]-phospholipid O-acyltransferase/long-chain-fatty-acid--[acyl-carrier-protein] ligase
MQSPESMKNEAGYTPLLADSRFEAFLWTQFLGAFNDNVYKMIVSLVSVRMAAQAAGHAGGGRYLALAGAVFVVPFLLFAGYAGQLADRFSKTRVLQVTKSFEIVAMLMGLAALMTGRIDLLLLVLFLLATQANFFSPAKYGILPETIGEVNLSRANGLLELTTFVAIVIGTSFGTFLYERWQLEPAKMGLVLLGIAAAGTLASLHIRKVPAAGVKEAFRWNPFHEIVAGARVIRRDPSLTFCVIGITWFWFIGALFQLALLLEGKEVLHVSESHVGFLVTALAAGIGAGSVAAGTISGKRIELGLVPVGSLFMGVFGILLGRTANYGHALFYLAGLGFAAGLFAVPLNAWLQEKADARERGRILATNNFANMVGVIGASGVLWLLHDKAGWNPGSIILAVGIAMLLGAYVTVAAIPLACFRFVMRSLINLMFRIEVEGEDNIPLTGGALLAANHVSYADALLVGLTTPRTARFMMRRIYYEMPVAKHVFRMLKAVPVEEVSPRTITMALREAHAVLEEGHLFAIFPEGHITLDGEIKEFKRGFERIMRGLPVPIIPIGIEGVWGHPLSCKNGDAFRSWDHLWRPRVSIRVGAPIWDPITPEELRRKVIALATESAGVPASDAISAEMA